LTSKPNLHTFFDHLSVAKHWSPVGVATVKDAWKKFQKILSQIGGEFNGDESHGSRIRKKSPKLEKEGNIDPNGG